MLFRKDDIKMNQHSDEENKKKIEPKKGFFQKVKLSIFNVENILKWQ